ncbi:hypothetical protein GCM10027258_93010 [Amycolatopsis stemonae]
MHWLVPRIDADLGPRAALTVACRVRVIQPASRKTPSAGGAADNEKRHEMLVISTAMVDAVRVNTSSDLETHLRQYQPPLGTPHAVAEALHNLAAAAAGANPELRALFDLPEPGDVPLDAVQAGLQLLPREERRLERTHLRLIEAALDRGANLSLLGEWHGLSRQGMRELYHRLGGTRELPPGRPKNPPPYTVTRYWVARHVAELDEPGPRRGEITPLMPLPGRPGGTSAIVTGGGFRSAEPSAEESVVFLGDLPAPGDVAEGVIRSWGHETPEVSETRVFVRAENVPLPPS